MGLSPFWLYMLPETDIPGISRSEHQSAFHQVWCKIPMELGPNAKPAGIESFPHFGYAVPAMPNSLCDLYPCRWKFGRNVCRGQIIDALLRGLDDAGSQILAPHTALLRVPEP